jgi:predicted MFS family arabinose efflux permease
MSGLRNLKPAAPILVGAAVMLSLSMGLRQSLGLFVQPATHDLSIAVSDFTLALAIQNLAWGFLQPVAGAVAGRTGFRTVMMAGVVLYLAGLLTMATAQGFPGILIGAGVLIGTSLACTASAIGLSVASRSVSAEIRSTVLGMVSAAGSLGALVSAPIGQTLATEYGWRAGLFAFFALACIMLPAAWIAGRVDRTSLPPSPLGAVAEKSMAAALRTAMGNSSFLVMAGAYFVCGLQLVFLTTHLPSYLLLCGMDPMLSAQALGVIGGCNVIGSLFFGWAGGRWSKQGLLGCIYITRSLVLAWYFTFPPTPATTLIFAALMGLLWLGVAPLVAGAVAEMFGLRWQSMIQGVAFMSHQLGSFVGAYGGGAIYDALGSYDLAWKLGVGMGLTAGTIQLIASLPRPPGKLGAGIEAR